MSSGPLGASSPGGPPAQERTGVPDSPGVALAYIFGEHVVGWFSYAKDRLLVWDANHDRHIVGPKGDIIAVSSSPRIFEARNTVVDIFAQSPAEPEWLLMLDADMTFEPDLVDRMLEVADPDKVPVLGGLCFAGGRHSNPYPTIYKGVAKDNYVSIDRYEDYPRDALVQVQATGGAALLVHRRVLSAMQVAYDKTGDGYPNPYPWFADGIVGPGGEGWGEDTLFCLRCAALEIPVHVDTRIKLGHVKQYILDETYFDNYNETKRRDAEEAAATNGNGNRAERRRQAREKAAG